MDLFGIINGLINPEIDYSGLLAGIVLYLVAMWFMFTLWVFIDAKKRFNNMWVAVLFTFFILPLNVPGFLLYLIARPEHEYEDWDSLLAHDSQYSSHGGVHVPLVHFTGDDGEIHMSFGLSLNPRIAKDNSDMNVDISWDSNRKDMELRQTTSKQPVAAAVVDARTGKSVSGRFSKLRSKAQESMGVVAGNLAGSLSKSSQQLSEAGEGSEIIQEPEDKEKSKPRKKAKKKSSKKSS